MYDDDKAWRAAGCPRDAENVPIIAGQQSEHEASEKPHQLRHQASYQDDGDIQEDEPDATHQLPSRPRSHVRHDTAEKIATEPA